MDAEQQGSNEAPRAKAGRGWFLALALALATAGGGALAGALGYLAPIHALVSSPRQDAQQPAVAFLALPRFQVPLDPLANFPASSPASVGRNLHAVVQLEVERDRLSQVESVQPRIVDTLLTFLHALNERDFATAYNLNRVKAQMLYRVREVTGDDAVRGVLLTELAIL